MVIFALIFGLIIGSFLEAYTSRAPIGEKISKGRSKCPHCKKQILAKDKIPLISFLLLGGKCRNCTSPIPRRCPIIELTTATLFTIMFLFQPQIIANIPWLSNLPSLLVTGYVLLITALLVATFITDFEYQIILDEIVFLGLIATLLLLIFYFPPFLYPHLVAGFVSALFLLSLHLITKGRGMGLGDVKLALFVGTVLGPFASFIWMFLSFIIGAIFGLVLLATKTKKFKDKIAFGPFLVIAFFVYIFLAQYLDPYLLLVN